MPINLDTRRLRLVPLAESDGKRLAELYSDPEVSRFIGGNRLNYDAATQQAKRFAAVWKAHGFGQSAVVERSSAKFVGRIGLHPWPSWNELELGWVIAQSHQRQGFATEAATAWLEWAADNRKIHELIAVISPENEPSIRTARRLGFAFDREDITPEGTQVVIYRIRV